MHLLYFRLYVNTFIYKYIDIDPNMPKSPDTSTISIDPSGRVRVTIPRPLAEQLDMKTGQKVKWRVTGKGKLEMQV